MKFKGNMLQNIKFHSRSQSTISLGTRPYMANDRRNGVARYSMLVSAELPARHKLDRRRTRNRYMFLETQCAFTFRLGGFSF